MAAKKVNVKDTAILVGGSLGAQLITLLLTPVITRLFAPDQFGLFATVLALAVPIVAISSLRYFDAIMLPRTDAEALKLFMLSIYLTTAFALILLVVVYLFLSELSGIFGINENMYLFYMVPLLVLLIGTRRVVDAWLQRFKAYKTMASSAIITSVLDRFVTISMGLAGYATAWGLLAGRVSGVVSGIIAMTYAAFNKGAGVTDHNEKYSMRSVAIKYASFAKYSWSAWVMQLAMELPVLVIGAFFNPVVVGLYALSRRVLMEPAVLVGEALSKTFYVKAAELHKKNESLSATCESMLVLLLKISIPPACIFAVSAPDIFQVVFGDEWRAAGIYTVYLLPMFLMGFYLQPLGRLFNVLEKQRELASFSLYRLVGMTIALSIGVFLGEPEMLFISMSLATLFIGMSRMRWILREIGVDMKQLARAFIIDLVVGACIAGIVYLASIYYVLSEIAMTIMVVVVCSVYCIYVYRYYKQATAHAVQGKQA